MMLAYIHFREINKELEMGVPTIRNDALKDLVSAFELASKNGSVDVYTVILRTYRFGTRQSVGVLLNLDGVIIDVTRLVGLALHLAFDTKTRGLVVGGTLSDPGTYLIRTIQDVIHPQREGVMLTHKKLF